MRYLGRINQLLGLSDALYLEAIAVDRCATAAYAGGCLDSFQRAGASVTPGFAHAMIWRRRWSFARAIGRRYSCSGGEFKAGYRRAGKRMLLPYDVILRAALMQLGRGLHIRPNGLKSGLFTR